MFCNVPFTQTIYKDISDLNYTLDQTILTDICRIFHPTVTGIHILFSHSFVDRNLGCFYILDIGNSAVINTGVQMSLQGKDFSMYQVEELHGHVVVVCLIFCKKLHSVSIIAVLVIFSPTEPNVPVSSHHLKHLSSFDSSYAHKHVIIIPSVFYSHFSDDYCQITISQQI
jgi:hypothetical protein